MGVVDVTDVRNMFLVKVFEPIKLEDGKVGAADGKATDVQVVGDHAYFSYDSFGVVCYSLADLIEPLTDRYQAHRDMEEERQRSAPVRLPPRQRPADSSSSGCPATRTWTGAPSSSTTRSCDGKLVFYVAFGEAGVAKIGWDDPAAPQLVALAPTAGECTAVTVSQGRVYVADYGGGLVFFK